MKPDYQHVALFGDSTQWGAHGKSNDNQLKEFTPAKLLGRLLKAAGVAAITDNMGLPGLDTKGRLFGSEATEGDGITRPLTRPWKTEMAESKAGFVVNNTLINDVFLHTPPPSVDDFKAWYTQLVIIAREHDRHMVIETPNPVLAFDPINASALPPQPDKVKRFKELIAAQREVVQTLGRRQPSDDPHDTTSVHLVDQFPLITEYISNWRHAFATDPLHPNAVLYSAKALNLFWTLHPLMTNEALRTRGAWSAPLMPRHVFDQAFKAFTDPGKRDGDKWAVDILIAAMDPY